MKKLLLNLLVGAFVALPLHAQSIPSPAAAAGFNNLVFDDEFTTNDVTASQAATAGFKWYPFGVYAAATSSEISVATGNLYAVNGTLTSKAPASPTAAQTAAGVLTLTGDGLVSSVPYAPNVSGLGSYPALPGSFSHGYYEARIQVNPTIASGNSGWPSFWGYGTSWFANNSTNGKGPFSAVAEDDFLETIAQSGIVVNGVSYKYFGANTLHNWTPGKAGALSDTSNTSGASYYYSLTGTSTAPDAIIADGNWHVYGHLWASTGSATGYTQDYLDGYLINRTDLSGHNNITRFLTGVGTGKSSGTVTTVNGVVCYTAPGSGITAQEQDHLNIVLGCGTGWPINVDWVHVWQAGTGTVTPPPPPPALTPQTVTESYSLAPAMTDQGLPLVFSLPAGSPAKLTGTTLTAPAGTGAVVVNVSQAGNSTYAAYTDTETITFP